MRNSMIQLLETAYNVKVFCAQCSYELYDYDDGSYVDIKVRNINDPRTLCRLVKNLDFRLIEKDGYILIRIVEDFKEY